MTTVYGRSYLCYHSRQHLRTFAWPNSVIWSGARSCHAGPPARLSDGQHAPTRLPMLPSPGHEKFDYGKASYYLVTKLLWVGKGVTGYSKPIRS